MTKHIDFQKAKDAFLLAREERAIRKMERYDPETAKIVFAGYLVLATTLFILGVMVHAWLHDFYNFNTIQ